MIQNHEHIAYLVTRFNNGTLTDSEKQELDQWMQSNDRHRQLFEELTDRDTLRLYLQQMESFNENENWEKIRNEYLTTVAPVRKMMSWKKIVAAAAVIVVVGFGAYYAFFNNTGGQQQIIEDVKPPSVNKATITLVDGRKMTLDSTANGLLTQQGNVKLVKLADGQIVYQAAKEAASETIQYNTLDNPRGSKVIDMTFADGSRVWLNAGSSVTYPVAFTGNERRVTIKGEAYFEVAHDASKPFIVTKGEMAVTVLGTQFNVNAYDDEETIHITLLQGSVEVSLKASSVKLKPGEQAQVGNDIKLVQKADLQQVMAWKNGLFKFNASNVGAVMRELSRWYDVEVSYPNGVPQDHYGGTIRRDMTLAGVVSVLRESGAKFRIEGKKLIVIP